MYGVNVTTLAFGEDEYIRYFETVSAEIMSGEGPDVIFDLDMLNIDINKAAKNGVFLNLNEFFERDDEFDREDYIQPVLDAGRFDGKQYVVSISFSFPVYLSSPGHLADVGFDWSDVSTTADFMNHIAEAVPSAQQKDGFSQIMQRKNYGYSFLKYSGMQIINYTSKTVLPDEDEVRLFYESYKKYFPTDYQDVLASYSDNLGYIHLLANEFYFYPVSLRIDTFFGNASALKTGGGYTFSSLPGMDGKVHACVYQSAAIRANSKNQMNAYHFIKTLLSDDVQNVISGISVNKTAVSYLAELARLRYTPSLKSHDGTIYTQLTEEEAQEFKDMLLSVDACTLMGGDSYEMLYKAMLPYLKDESSYESCIDEFRNQLNLYLSE